MSDTYHTTLKKKIHYCVMCAYDISENFPKSELYGTTSQLRRSAVSIMLNYTEGYARFKPKVKINFYETAYGSTKEVKYLIFLAYERNWITSSQYNQLITIVDEIGKMIWPLLSQEDKNS